MGAVSWAHPLLRGCGAVCFFMLLFESGGSCKCVGQLHEMFLICWDNVEWAGGLGFLQCFGEFACCHDSGVGGGEAWGWTMPGEEIHCVRDAFSVGCGVDAFVASVMAEGWGYVPAWDTM